MPRWTVPAVAMLTVALALAGCIGGSAPAADDAPNASNATDGAGNATIGDGPVTQIRHVHDRWDGEQVKTLLDDTVETDSTTALDPTEPAVEAFQCALTCGSLVQFTPAEGEIVPPGTERVELTLTWDASPPPGHELRVFGSYMSANDTGWRGLPELASGEPVTLNTSVEEADGGHAKESLWRFQVFVAVCTQQTEGVNLYCLSRLDTDSWSADVTIEAHRVNGTLPPEPPHPDWWADGPSRTVLSVSNSETTAGAGEWYASSDGCLFCRGHAWWSGGDHGAVPPGSKVLVATVNWTNDAPTQGTRADVQPWLMTNEGRGFQAIHWDADERGESSATFTMPLREDQTDGIYVQNRSRWRFTFGFQGASGTVTEDPVLGTSLSTPYAFDGDWSVEIAAYNTTELPG